MNSASVIAIAGLITTALAPLLYTAANARTDRAARLHDLRTSLYTEATIFAQVAERRLDWVVDRYASRPPDIPELPHADVITARMRLLAPASVHDAWTQLLAAQDRLAWEVGENYPEVLVGEGELPNDDVHVQDVRQAASRFYSAAQAQLGTGPKGRPAH